MWNPLSTIHRAVTTASTWMLPQIVVQSEKNSDLTTLKNAFEKTLLFWQGNTTKIIIYMWRVNSTWNVRLFLCMWEKHWALSAKRRQVYHFHTWVYDALNSLRIHKDVFNESDESKIAFSPYMFNTKVIDNIWNGRVKGPFWSGTGQIILQEKLGD